MTQTMRSRPEADRRQGNGRDGLGAALVAAGLTKVFRHPWTLRTKTAVADLSLTVERGEVFGLLGPNGAGKTTTLKLLTGLLRPTGGRAWLLGEPAGEPASRGGVGFLPEKPYFYDYLTAREYLTSPGGCRASPAQRRAAARGTGSSASASARAPTRCCASTRRGCCSGSGWRMRCCTTPSSSSSTSR